MQHGTVKWFNYKKGYGFITPDQGDADIFLHISALEKAGITSINEGQKISFEVAVSRGKKAAANVQLAN